MSIGKRIFAKADTAFVLIEKPDNADATEVAANITSYLNNSNYEVMDWQTMIPELVETIEADSAGGVMMILVLYMIITFGIFGTILMMTAERRYEFGVLISIGLQRIQLAFYRRIPLKSLVSLVLY